VGAKVYVPFGSDAKIAFELKWDKEYYQPGDTAVLSVYMAVQDDVPLFTGNISIGLNSAFISKDNVPADCVEVCDLFASYYKALDSSNTKETTEITFNNKTKSASNPNTGTKETITLITVTITISFLLYLKNKKIKRYY